MKPGEFDLVGFAVGGADRSRLLTGEKVAPGDVLIGLPSPNLRANGFSLVRRVLLERAGLPLDGPAWAGAGHTLADELLDPSVIYAPAVLAALDAVDVRAVAHITGGGIPGNLVRVLPEGTRAVVDRSTWEVPRIFAEVARHGEVSGDEMARVFNLGIGMIVVVPESDVPAAVATLTASGHAVRVIGHVEAGDGGKVGEGVRLTGRPGAAS
jgi:phosphoribosylformylglycinamidine cyclo-ligase